MKVYVRHEGNELMFPSFKELQVMYRLKFIAPEDLVRKEFSDRWTPAGDLPELRRAQASEKMGRAFALMMWLMLATLAVGVLGQLFLKH